MINFSAFIAGVFHTEKNLMFFKGQIFKTALLMKKVIHIT